MDFFLLETNGFSLSIYWAFNSLSLYTRVGPIRIGRLRTAKTKYREQARRGPSVRHWVVSVPFRSLPSAPSLPTLRRKEAHAPAPPASHPPADRVGSGALPGIDASRRRCRPRSSGSRSPPPAEAEEGGAPLPGPACCPPRWSSSSSSWWHRRCSSSLGTVDTSMSPQVRFASPSLSLMYGVAVISISYIPCCIMP